MRNSLRNTDSCRRLRGLRVSGQEEEITLPGGTETEG